ncbi:amidohydrolase family protein [candidate division KSB1 bacterium]
MRRLYVGICCLIIAFYVSTLSPVSAAYTLSSMPRVDVHCHISDLGLMEDYLAVSGILKEKYAANLELFIDLQNYSEKKSVLEPGFKGIEYLEAAEEKYKGRFLMCIGDYVIADGLAFPPAELPEWLRRGVIGYKIWVAVSPLVDHPANDPTFAKMEQIDMVGASIHISQPFPTRWCPTPEEFWGAHNAWERVLDRHPDLIVVNAHMLDHFNSDEQLDYLMYVLETYPNVNVDVAARFQNFNRMSNDKLRSFFVKYADRILFGTDISGQPGNGHEQTAESYARCFKLLETDEVVEGGFFGRTKTKGLKLPQDVLEKIYFRNAARIYPRVGDVLKELGYEIE